MKWWRQIYVRDAYRCQYCGGDLISDLDSWMSIELDHLRPAAGSGTNDPENLVTSCNICNRLKGHWAPEGYESFGREELLVLAREYVMRRRAAWTIEYLKGIEEYRMALPNLTSPPMSTV